MGLLLGLVDEEVPGDGDSEDDGLVVSVGSAVPLGSAVGVPSLGEDDGSDGSPPRSCSASMTSRICSSKDVSCPWISSSGTEPMSCP